MRTILITWALISSSFIFYGVSFQPSLACAEQLLLPEYAIKAAFLYNFGKFVDWPAPSYPRNTSDHSFNICILGEDPFGENISAIKGKTVQSRAIRISYADSVEHMDEIKQSAILFISQSEEKHLSEIIAVVKDYPILTVADTKGAAQLGVMINLIRANDSVRFEINLNSAKHAEIRISSQLLKLATNVID